MSIASLQEEQESQTDTDYDIGRGKRDVRRRGSDAVVSDIKASKPITREVTIIREV